jgi:hypothetical protein
MKKQFLTVPIGPYRAPNSMILSDQHPHTLGATVKGQFAAFLLAVTAVPLPPFLGSE